MKKITRVVLGIVLMVAFLWGGWAQEASASMEQDQERIRQLISEGKAEEVEKIIETYKWKEKEAEIIEYTGLQAYILATKTKGVLPAIVKIAEHIALQCWVRLSEWAILGPQVYPDKFYAYLYASQNNKENDLSIWRTLDMEY